MLKYIFHPIQKPVKETIRRIRLLKVFFTRQNNFCSTNMFDKCDFKEFASGMGGVVSRLYFD